MSNIAIILGAGSGTRMKSEKSKLLLEINGKTVIERTVAAFSRVKRIDGIIVVCRESDLESFKTVLADYDNITYCFGGSTRQQSVMNAVTAIDECNLLLIHDGARPLITEKEINDTIGVAEKYGAAAVGVPVKDTIKVVDKDMQIVDTPNRSTLISIRTPQIFSFDIYRKAVELAKQQGKDFTDDCQLVENYGRPVYAVIGDYGNIKITTPEDIPLAQSILEMRGEK